MLARSHMRGRLTLRDIGQSAGIVLAILTLSLSSAAAYSGFVNLQITSASPTTACPLKVPSYFSTGAYVPAELGILDPTYGSDFSGGYSLSVTLPSTDQPNQKIEFILYFEGSQAKSSIFPSPLIYPTPFFGGGWNSSGVTPAQVPALSSTYEAAYSIGGASQGAALTIAAAPGGSTPCIFTFSNGLAAKTSYSGHATFGFDGGSSAGCNRGNINFAALSQGGVVPIQFGALDYRNYMLIVTLPPSGASQPNQTIVFAKTGAVLAVYYQNTKPNQTGATYGAPASQSFGAVPLWYSLDGITLADSLGCVFTINQGFAVAIPD